jgi:hypothetical protein
MDIVEELLANRKWVHHCLRANIAPPEKVEQWKKTRVAYVTSNSITRTKHDQKLKEAIKNIAPEWWDNKTRICLNRNVKCERHKDGNRGHSYILWLGDFTGGALVFDDGTRIEEKYTWHKINGQIPHWNEEHEGTKYSIIIYQGASDIKKSDRIIARRRTVLAENQNLKE